MKATIKITQRMINKSIIDANKSVVELFLRNLVHRGYVNIDNGAKQIVRAVYDDGSRYTETEIRLYRRPRGDKLLSIKGLSKRATAGDVVTIEYDEKIGAVVRVAAAVEETVEVIE